MEINGRKTSVIDGRTAETLLEKSPRHVAASTVSSYFAEKGLYWRRREVDGARFNTWELPEAEVLDIIAQNERLMNRVAELRLLVKQRDPTVRKTQVNRFKR